MNRTNMILCAVVASCATSTMNSAHAANFSFAGDIAFHNDVVNVSFELFADATDVKVWTDSYGGPAAQGVNFDPITAVWSLSAGGKLVDRNDDDDSIAPGQTEYDSGLVFSSLKAGKYMFTIATYHNWNNGDWLSDGFNYDGETPMPLSVWEQPSSHVGMGAHWAVHLTGVDAASPPVPEPSSCAMMLAGLATISFGVWRSKLRQSAPSALRAGSTLCSLVCSDITRGCDG